MINMTQQYPSLKNIQDPEFGRPKDAQSLLLHQAVRPHIESFDCMLCFGLNDAIKVIQPIEFLLPNNDQISISLCNVSIGVPKISEQNIYGKTIKFYPAEARMSGTTYAAPLRTTLSLKVNGKELTRVEKVVCEIPIMTKSLACNLRQLSAAELVARGEEPEEMGGTFIINGNEKVVRQTIRTRQNHPFCVKRSAWQRKGADYSEYGIMICSQRLDRTSSTIILHYLSRGSAVFSFICDKQQFFMPVCLVMRAITNADDLTIFRQLMRGRENDQFYKLCVIGMLRELAEQNLFTQRDALSLIGSKFRIKLPILAPWISDIEVAKYLLRMYVLPHLSAASDKMNLLNSMTRKLFVFAAGGCAADNLDSPSNHEVLQAGHIYLMALSHSLQSWLRSMKNVILKKNKTPEASITAGLFTSVLKLSSRYIVQPVITLLSTGNMSSSGDFGLMQTSGFAVLADRLNFYRYLSHFRAIHRGAYFATSRDSSVRKLLPEAFGFLCPVHTPDGAPCGLLNHLAATCQIVNYETSLGPIEELLYSTGVLSPLSTTSDDYCNYLEVFLNGRVMGLVHRDRAEHLVLQLRKAKIFESTISSMLEIALVLPTKNASQYPGLFLFTSMGRMMRSVWNIRHDKLEMIGSFEQVYMDIAVKLEEAYRDDQGEMITTHREVSECSMLSYLANLTPFSDFNQSPRNMYQCQMAKQTMGTPLHSYPFRSDNKLYRLQTPQTPMVRPRLYDEYNMDEYPLGTNAVVAVISYTGYDMEDAFILNRASYQRGFCHGSIIKTEVIELADTSIRLFADSVIFATDPNNAVAMAMLGSDGLPPIGQFLRKGDPLYSFQNTLTGQYKVKNYEEHESAYVDHIKVIGHPTGGMYPLSKVAITFRIPRNPMVGDKFASRAGQKGICSQLWPVENMPFSETGMTPDILFNPHGYPSRMTIGMMVETMAGKSAACHGMAFDATPFTFGEDDSAIDYFGQCLTKAGYNYYGTEKLYNGVTGVEMEAEIFIGVVYYQRLRHMVSDKFQVRSTGARDPTTHQPIKGRSRGGGVRFGEMERDSLLSHGTAFLLQDRLQSCSDLTKMMICTKCGSALSAVNADLHRGRGQREKAHTWRCTLCAEPGTISEIEIPYSFKYLATELASCNIKLKLTIE